jgi:hypothetical protein
VELANFAGDTVVQVADAAEQGDDVPGPVELRWRPMTIRPLPPPDPRVCV